MSIDIDIAAIQAGGSSIVPDRWGLFDVGHRREYSRASRSPEQVAGRGCAGAGCRYAAGGTARVTVRRYTGRVH